MWKSRAQCVHGRVTRGGSRTALGVRFGRGPPCSPRPFLVCFPAFSTQAPLLRFSLFIGLHAMENVPPPSMNHNGDLPTLDDLLRPKRNVKSSRQKRSPALNTRTNADSEDEDSHAESGLLTPPSSQTQEEDMDPSRMLFSPPPEEVLRHERGSVSITNRPYAQCAFQTPVCCAIRLRLLYHPKYCITRPRCRPCDVVRGWSGISDRRQDRAYDS